MIKPLRILHLEDDPDYPELVRSMLEAEGLEVVVVPVANRPEFEAALEREPFDLILADYSLREGYDGIQALRQAQDTCRDTPFLVVSGTIGEEAAIQSLKSGATDYVLKDWPERLVPAVRRAVREAEERRRRREAEIELRRSQEQSLAMQKRLEEQLRQAQKMEAIGQLAGGVAHDFNNILTVIHGHAELLLAEGGLEEKAAHSVRQMSQAAARAATLTRQLLAFSRRQVIQPRLLDMNEIVGNITKMLSRIMGEDVALQLQYASGPAPVQADVGMMEQVLLNLVVNARDAMPQGGRLVLTVAVVEVEAARLDQHPAGRAGRFVCLSVADTGCGIAPDNLGRIFEPFFTTKEVGRGTGLGLATVYGIVNQHQGWVEVQSALGKGSTFTVFLPWSDAVPAAPLEDRSLSSPPRGGNELILVVEDEAPLRELVGQCLARCGYRILLAESGAKALELWAAHRDEISLVLTDLVMPDRMNGRQLADRLQAERPELKVLFTSGYSADVVGKDFVLRPGLNYLQKPFQPQTLGAIVRACLNGSPPPG
jgi:signal transduction histidine kinase